MEFKTEKDAVIFFLKFKTETEAEEWPTIDNPWYITCPGGLARMYTAHNGMWASLFVHGPHALGPQKLIDVV